MEEPDRDDYPPTKEELFTEWWNCDCFNDNKDCTKCPQIQQDYCKSKINKEWNEL
jgi:hypothetical protein